MKKKTKILGLLGILLIITIISGYIYQYNSNFKTYNGNTVTFKYPASWRLLNETNTSIRFNTSNGQLKVVINSPHYDESKLNNYQEGQINNVTYYSQKGKNHNTYVVITNDASLSIKGPRYEANGIKTVISTLQLK